MAQNTRDGAPSTSSEGQLELMSVPEEFAADFAYLHGTALYYMQRTQKLSRVFSRHDRICFITDYTLNVATAHGGEVTHCCRVDDVAEVIVHPKRRSVGIRMRERPFDAPISGISYRAYYTMPVDTLLVAYDTDSFNQLMAVLSVVYQSRTSRPLPVRELRAKEMFEEVLYLAPDGRRVAHRAMPFHRVEDLHKYKPTTSRVTVIGVEDEEEVSGTEAVADEEAALPTFSAVDSGTVSGAQSGEAAAPVAVAPPVCGDAIPPPQPTVTNDVHAERAVPLPDGLWMCSLASGPQDASEALRRLSTAEPTATTPSPLLAQNEPEEFAAGFTQAGVPCLHNDCTVPSQSTQRRVSQQLPLSPTCGEAPLPTLFEAAGSNGAAASLSDETAVKVATMARMSVVTALALSATESSASSEERMAVHNPLASRQKVLPLFSKSFTTTGASSSSGSSSSVRSGGARRFRWLALS